MNKAVAKTGSERDWCSDARRAGHITHKAGTGRFIKRCMNKRARREGRAETQTTHTYGDEQ
jgi:hypothetical protein